MKKKEKKFDMPILLLLRSITIIWGQLLLEEMEVLFMVSVQINRFEGKTRKSNLHTLASIHGSHVNARNENTIGLAQIEYPKLYKNTKNVHKNTRQRTILV